MAEEKKGLFGKLGEKLKGNAEQAQAQANNAKTAAAAANTVKTTAKTAVSAANAAKAVTPAKTATTASTTSKTAATAAKSAATVTAAKTVTTAAAAKKSTFADVPANAYYAAAVEWAVKKGVTTGIDANTFAPNNNCHRGHAATFIWRSKGSPEPKAKTSPFTDVAENSPFYKAIIWASENGIISGKDGTTFAPTEQCTQGQVLSYIFRANGNPNASESDAYTWAKQKNLLLQTSAADGNTNAPCTRADFVTFLYRASLGSK